ncbi:lebercilin-like protein [Cyclopterus lumpus]|uniref:Lebercilin-like protein n=1 Tax=Cyclopterus lumpus TaxID=8103 RepID=A0A8C2YZP2_CYCLU|nr:lebercilin-like protein [Cyclopterus lumpus]
MCPPSVQQERESLFVLKSGGADREAMQSRRQQAIAHKEEGDSDAVRSRTDTSWWSPPSRLRCDSNRSYSTSDSEDLDERLIDKASEVQTSDKWLGSNTQGRIKGKKAQGPQKTNHTANRHFLKLPPIKIKPLQVSEPRIRSADLNCIRELKSKILMCQRNQARVLLRETCACRDNLARQLQTTENKLPISYQHLLLLSRDHSLLEREELTSRLYRATAELEDKDKRILDLERNLKLCQASFHRQIATEQRKINEARKISCYLQEHTHQLNREIQGRERELETHNIYSHRFLKGPSKKVSEIKIVQTDALVLLPTAAASPLALEHTETKEKLEENSVNWYCYNPVQESLVVEHPDKEVSETASLEENRQDETDTSERCSSSEGPRISTEEECTGEKEAPQMMEEEQKPEEQSLNLTEPERKGPEHQN